MGASMTVFVIALVLTAQASGPTGVVRGCISEEITAQRLPGATITATAAGVKRTVEADRSGCYELTDIPVGAYRVTARLRGFNNVTHDGVTVWGATLTELHFTTRPSSICECITPVGPTLTEQWNYADVVVHVR